MKHPSATERSDRGLRIAIIMLCALLICPPEALTLAAASRAQTKPEKKERTVKNPTPVKADSTAQKAAYLDAELLVPVDTASMVLPDDTKIPADSVLTVVVDEKHPYGLDGKIPFNPNPIRAVWLSALFPGLGQIYNRRYWKLPIIVGGFMGLGYATSWNNNQYQDYTQGYRDIMDNDPNTKSYMNFFPPTVSEESLDKEWLTTIMRNRKDYYRRNRDLCIISLVGLYLLCILDAYVDASLSHFDISPDLALDVTPTMFITPRNSKPAFGLNWAFTF